MRKIEKKKIISVPTASQSVVKTKPVKKTLTKSRSVHAKENTLAYYDCLLEQIAKSSRQKTKITQLAHYCKCKKSEVVQAQQAHKQKLIQQLAQSYKTFGENLGHY